MLDFNILYDGNYRSNNILCKTQKEAIELLDIVKNFQGIWASNVKVADETYWDLYKENSVYIICNVDGDLTVSVDNYIGSEYMGCKGRIRTMSEFEDIERYKIKNYRYDYRNK